MAKKVRVGSYNVENLFRRPKILNLQDSEKIRSLLNAYAELNDLASRKTYSNADKKRMAVLLTELKGYVKANSYIGKFANRNGRITANGADDWLGSFDLVKQKFNERTRRNTAWVIRQMNADILCVIEAEDRPTLKKFGSDLLRSSGAFRKYPFNMLIDGNDGRGIDVGVYSRYPIRDIRTNITADSGKKSVFSRDCLEVEIDVGLSKPVNILVNHLKSKGYGAPAQSDRRRKSQAEAIASILKTKYDLARDYVVVAGDLNDTPDSAPLRPLTTISRLHDVLELQFGPQMDQRWTYEYRNELNQIDYMLVSAAMRPMFKSAGVERRGMWVVEEFTNGAVKRYRKITKKSESASDHGGVYADFDLS